MANARMLTRVTNNVERRRVSYIPPNGRVMEFGETAVIPGAIETSLYLAAERATHEEYIYDLLNDRITVITEGFGGGGGVNALSTVVGNGSDTVFSIDAGFSTASATVILFDNFGGGIISAFQVTLASPGPTEITLELNPAPAPGQVQVFIFA